MKNIVLIGMPGTGKSVVGQALASRLGYEFVDVDDLIVERAGKTLPEILRQDGLEAFYKIEGQVGCDLNRQHTVIATGGSMVLYPEAMAHLKQDSVVVWLQTPFTQIQERMPADLYDRGIAAPKGESLREIYENRPGSVCQICRPDRGQPGRGGRYRPSGGGGHADRWPTGVMQPRSAARQIRRRSCLCAPAYLLLWPAFSAKFDNFHLYFFGSNHKNWGLQSEDRFCIISPMNF